MQGSIFGHPVLKKKKKNAAPGLEENESFLKVCYQTELTYFLSESIHNWQKLSIGALESGQSI